VGLVYVDARVVGPRGAREVRLLVDTGAVYTVLRREVWEAVGLEARRVEEFVLADGSVVRRAVGEAYIVIPGVGEGHSPVVLGESEDENLLGVVTLEIMGYLVDPFTRRLRKMRMLLK